MNEKLAALEKKKAQIEEQIKAQVSREKAKQRKAETRAKIILGGLFLRGLMAKEEGQRREIIAGYGLREQDVKALIDAGVIRATEKATGGDQPTVNHSNQFNGDSYVQ